MSADVDHVFVCVHDLRVAERTLADFGVYFGLRARHEGQGTENACAFFDNAYLELLGWRDERELQSPAVRPLALSERFQWRQTGASPFGVALRVDAVTTSLNAWPYEAPFLPLGESIPILTARSAAHEPLIFLITPELPRREQVPGAHRGKQRRLTHVTVSGPGLYRVSAQMEPLCNPALLTIRQASAHSLELERDGGKFGASHDFYPTLPLVLRW